MSRAIFLSMILYLVGQSLVWIQSNGQFIWPWFKKNPLLIAIMGIPVSYIFIIGTRLSYEGFNALWPGRMMGFAAGILVFSFLSYHVMGEQISLKTAICIALSISIICIQIFMK